MQDNQRQQSLELREQAVAEREALLDSSDLAIQLELLDKQIAIKNDIRDNLDLTIKTKQNIFTKVKEDYCEKIEQLDKNIAKKQAIYNTLVFKSEQFEKTFSDKRTEIIKLKQEVRLQKIYIVDQEEIVNNTVADWNAQLTGMQQEVDELQQTKNLLSADIIRLEQQQIVKTEEFEIIRQKITNLQELYDRNMKSFKATIADLKSQIQGKENELQMSKIAQKEQLEAIATSEQAINIKEAAQRVIDLELSDREQSLNLKLNLI